MKIAVACIVVAGFLFIGAGPAAVIKDIQSHPACSFCGMDPQQYPAGC